MNIRDSQDLRINLLGSATLALMVAALFMVFD